jgi:hypothetical protein
MQEQTLRIGEAQAGEATLGKDDVPCFVDDVRPDGSERWIHMERIDQYGETPRVYLGIRIQQQYEITRSVRHTQIAAIGEAAIARRAYDANCEVLYGTRGLLGTCIVDDGDVHPRQARQRFDAQA